MTGDFLKNFLEKKRAKNRQSSASLAWLTCFKTLLVIQIARTLAEKSSKHGILNWQMKEVSPDQRSFMIVSHRKLSYAILDARTSVCNIIAMDVPCSVLVIDSIVSKVFVILEIGYNYLFLGGILQHECNSLQKNSSVKLVSFLEINRCRFRIWNK